ncbi:MAG: hypothetical protein SGARI_002614 [Bacillariaceae sp.]
MSFTLGLDDADQSMNFQDLHILDQEMDGSVSNKASSSSLQSKENDRFPQKSTVASSLIGKAQRTPSILKRKDATKIAANLVGKKAAARAGVRFSDTVDTKNISFLHRSALNDLFYASVDFSEMRYEAFMEECGLDPNEYD